MKLSVYEGGQAILTVPIKSKGKEGSWWETPSGLYKAEGKEEKHFSSFGHVYMPWSIPFQGNFFIHGWPYYPDGTPVSEGYSGGCIRLEDGYAKQVFDHVKIGTPILVFEESVEKDFSYLLRAPEVKAQHYLIADLENNFVLASGGAGLESKANILSKLMTAVVASEYKNIEEKVFVQESALGENTTTRLHADFSYSLYDLFPLLLLENSYEAERVIQEYFGRDRFLSLMQTKAKALGMNATIFSALSLENQKKEGETVGGVTTVEDVFLFLKYLYANRPFILQMSASKTDTRTYGAFIFNDTVPVHPFASSSIFLGGVVGGVYIDTIKNVGQQEASVVLAFANSDMSMPLTSEEGEDLISVFALTFNGVKRSVGVIILGSPDSKGDTEKLLSFAQGMYK